MKPEPIPKLIVPGTIVVRCWIVSPDGTIVFDKEVARPR
jgi:hypothetical protein